MPASNLALLGAIREGLFIFSENLHTSQNKERNRPLYDPTIPL